MLWEEKPARQAVVTVDRVDYALQANSAQMRSFFGFFLGCGQVSAFESMNEMLSAVQSHFLYWENEAACCMSTVGRRKRNSKRYLYKSDELDEMRISKFLFLQMTFFSVFLFRNAAFSPKSDSRESRNEFGPSQFLNQNCFWLWLCSAGFAAFYRGSDLWISESAKYFGCNLLCVAIPLYRSRVAWVAWMTLLPRQSQIIQVSEVLSIQLPPLQSVTSDQNSWWKNFSRRCLQYALYRPTAWFLTDLYLEFDVWCLLLIQACSLASKLCSPALIRSVAQCATHWRGWWYSSVLQRCGLGAAGLDIVQNLFGQDEMWCNFNPNDLWVHYSI